ncbi:MAG TPA: hypothetical protein VMQ52_02180 [Candidatus Saccharimonadales bacterium]|jgi:hypothetical protein|nr:hypothetical protein [Candidatus Saccharimonadales bacterium]
MPKIKYAFAECLLAVMIGISLSSPVLVRAAALNFRSLEISSPVPSAVNDYAFTFTLPDNTNVGSISFLFCTMPLVIEPCDSPAGLDASNGVLAEQSGETGFVIYQQDSNMILLERPPAPGHSEQVQYIFSNMANPSNPVQTFFVRISTFPTFDGTGPYTDYGAVASATSTGVSINTVVPPILDFCAGLTIPGNCSTASGYFIQFGDFSSLKTSAATSMMEVGTNANSGVVITVNGTTMTSGSYVIKNLASQTANTIGTSQFGLNLRANTNPVIGNDPAGGSTMLATAYDVSNEYQFNSGDLVAYSPGPTNLAKLTVSYIVNISSSQTVGIYDTTLTYICTASF